jgi:phosphoribosyl 1,2-cyclic phosphodiesterase
MKLKFWGVRGSIPTPLTSEQIRTRIAAVVQRIKSRDLKSVESRESFLSHLPLYIFGTVGGNTTCLELETDDGSIIVVDAGSGIRELGIDLVKSRKHRKNIHILFTHFHQDHLQGLPFFQPALMKGYTVHLYSPDEEFESYIRSQIKPPYFPVEMKVFPAELEFHIIRRPTFQIGTTEIAWMKMNHPGTSYSYRFQSDGKSVIFSTDAEITTREFKQNKENRQYFEKVDILILDSQYTLEESIDKIDWGHTSYSMAVDFAAEWKVKTLVLFHHEPMYNDKKVLGILRSAQWYAKHLENRRTRVILAVEGMELTV